MKCENIIKELYESSLSHMEKGLREHLQGCESCEKEYLKLKKLEHGFLNADRVKEKPSNLIRNFSVAFAVSCVLFFQQSPQVELSTNDIDQTQLAFSMAIDETEKHITDQYYDIDFSKEGMLNQEPDFEELSDFDAYEFAIVTIEDTIYNNTLEG